MSHEPNGVIQQETTAPAEQKAQPNDAGAQQRLRPSRGAYLRSRGRPALPARNQVAPPSDEAHPATESVLYWRGWNNQQMEAARVTLRHWREEAGLSLEDAARYISERQPSGRRGWRLSLTSLWRYENIADEIGSASIRIINTMCAVYRHTLADLARELGDAALLDASQQSGLPESAQVLAAQARQQQEHEILTFYRQLTPGQKSDVYYILAGMSQRSGRVPQAFPPVPMTPQTPQQTLEQTRSQLDQWRTRLEEEAQ